jgi:organic radical activating enzyme
MNILTPLINRFFPPHKPLPSGVFHYNAPPDAEFPYRLHLRIEPDHRAILVVNGSTVLHLNQTAAEYVYDFIQSMPADEIAKQVSQRYGIKASQAAQDYTTLLDNLKTMLNTQDLDPVTYLDFDRQEVYSGAVFAPYRLDCALTYRLPEAGYSHFTPVDRVKYELSTEEWKTILQKAWDAGIPHAVFTGGEPTLRPDLIELIIAASQLGMVTGLISNSFRLSEPDYLQKILASGLDHLMLVLEPEEEQSWEALRDVLVEDLAVTVHLTITAHDNLLNQSVMNRLVKMGVKSVSISAAAESLLPMLPEVRQAASGRGLRLVWDLPVPYSQLHPVALELASGEEAIPQGAGKAWLYVEPDGDVLPAQGDLTVLGNFLNDPWETIWKKVV